MRRLNDFWRMTPTRMEYTHTTKFVFLFLQTSRCNILLYIITGLNKNEITKQL